jgi:hypothetical protein
METFLPCWRDAMYPASRPGHYVSGDERRQREQKGRRVIEEWAKACQLGCVDGDGEETPDWLVDYASIFCERNESRGGTLHTTDGFYPSFFDPEPIPSQVRMAPPPGWHPDPDPGETWIQYRRRICKWLKKHWEGCQIDSKPRVRGKRVRPVGKTYGHELDHSEWFILYQYCKWDLKRIGKQYGRHGTGVEPAIREGIRSIAKRVGLKVTSRKSAPKKLDR